MSEGGAVEKAGRRRVIGGRITTFTNTFFFLFAGLASLWLVLLAYLDTRASRWVVVLFVVALWAVMAYVFLPRLYKLMTTIFLPDYFIGRARTSTGILGDVINMAWDGSDANIHRTMQAAGWTVATPITLKSSIKIVVSVVTHTSYSAAPVSPLFLLVVNRISPIKKKWMEALVNAITYDFGSALLTGLFPEGRGSTG